MRDDNDLACSHKDHDPSSEIIGGEDNHLESETANIKLSDKRRTFISLGEYLKQEKDSETPEHGENTCAFKDMNGDDSNISALCHNEHTRDMSAVSQPMTTTVNREVEFSMDKAVTEIERPKMIVCFQKDIYQVVKDICVDDGVHSRNNTSQWNKKLDQREVYMLSHTKEHECDITTNEKSSFNCSESLCVFGNPFHETDMKNVLHGSVNTREESHQVEEISDDVFYKEATAKDAKLQQEFDHYASQIDVMNADSNSEQLKLAENKNVPTSLNDHRDDQVPANQESLMASTVASVPTNSCTDECKEGEPPSNFTSEGTFFNSDFEASSSKLSEGTIESHQLEQSKVGSISGQDSTDNSNMLPQHSLVHCDHTESIMHGSGCSSDRISYTGQMAYSGSVSIRSDSSATSTRSFAFPILQPEWNSSPVRMAKADRKLYRKQRGWRAGLLCCRF